MSAMDDRAKAVLALTNQLVDTGVAPLKASELWRLLEVVDDPSTLLGRSSSELGADLDDLDLDVERLARLLDTGVALAVQLSALSDRGIWTLTPFDADYPRLLPDRLGHRAPAVLYGAGDAALLHRDESGPAGVGVVGSRAPDEPATEVARDVARAVAGLGLTVVSGGSVGIDQAALVGALDAGGTTVAILADSLETAIGAASTRRALLDGRSCLCTPYRPLSRLPR
jgi:DNA processing protein